LKTLSLTFKSNTDADGFFFPE